MMTTEVNSFPSKPSFAKRLSVKTVDFLTLPKHRRGVAMVGDP